MASDIREDALKCLSAEFDQLEAAKSDALEAQQAAKEAMADVDRLHAATMEATKVLREELRALSADRDSLLERTTRQAAELERAAEDDEKMRSRLHAYETEVAALNDCIHRLDRLNSEKDTLIAIASRDLGAAKASLEAECRISADVSSRLAQSQERAEATRTSVQELLELRNRLLGETKALRNQLDRANAKLSRERLASAQIADQLEHSLEEVARQSDMLETGLAREKGLEKLHAQARAEILVLQSRLEDKAKQCRNERAERKAIERKCRRLTTTHLRGP